MPYYDFKCDRCGKVEERKMSSDEMAKAVGPDAPKCGCGGSMERQLSAPSGFILKGGGFYRTDFKHK